MIRPIIAAAVVMSGTATGELMEGHQVSLPTVASVGMTVFMGAWWLSGRFTRLDDRIVSLEQTVSKLYCVENKICNGKEEK